MNAVTQKEHLRISISTKEVFLYSMVELNTDKITLF